MVCSCCVLDCTNSVLTNRKSSSTGTSISLYRFPRVRIRYSPKYQKLMLQQRLAWLAALRRDDLTDDKLDGLRVCSEHFASGTPSDFRDTENPDWVPHLSMGYQASDDEYECDKEESSNIDNSENQIMEVEPHFLLDQETKGESDVIEKSDISVQTDLSSAYIAALEAELLKRNEEIYELRKRLADVLWTEESFKNDDEKMSFYCGLPSFKLFKLILDQLESTLSNIKIKKMDNFQKLLLTLMKLRLNTSFKDLAYQFQISGISASNCFKKVIVLIVHEFQGFLHWPDRDALQTGMPQCFKEAFGNSVAVIIDCFEIPTHRPANADAHTNSLSNFKHNYTEKYLIGLTPHGFVSYISDDCTVLASDKFISEHSGLLDNLLPGDVVFSDQGFTIKESVSMHYDELCSPEFLHNKMQLAPEVVEKTRNIAAIRIHIEKIIGVIKDKFEILRGPVPTEFLKIKHDGNPILDYVVRSVCILMNLCDSTEPMGELHKENKNVNVLPTKVC